MNAALAVVEQKSKRVEIFCPDCGRYVTATIVPIGLSPLTVWTRAKCRTCSCWAWFDVATGRRKGDDLTESNN